MLGLDGVHALGLAHGLRHHGDVEDCDGSFSRDGLLLAGTARSRSLFCRSIPSFGCRRHARRSLLCLRDGPGGLLLGPLGLIPLPSKWRIEFCEPIEVSGYGPEAAEDRALVFELSEQVRETIQAKIYENLVKRGSAFI